ncbi:CLUMA_CG013054, isoform A [Clunio marinus]|uniref:CLUMA_CG013054, isoform A n=1 Tax=Clunio marinus TaxID=568069 RepID=A0A1J1IJ12_9DIPT|nr:CLUMA_CG013054, isoform A [Clunio marinus]
MRATQEFFEFKENLLTFLDFKWLKTSKQKGNLNAPRKRTIENNERWGSIKHTVVLCHKQFKLRMTLYFYIYAYLLAYDPENEIAIRETMQIKDEACREKKTKMSIWVNDILSDGND